MHLKQTLSLVAATLILLLAAFDRAEAQSESADADLNACVAACSKEWDACVGLCPPTDDTCMGECDAARERCTTPCVDAAAEQIEKRGLGRKDPE